MRKTRPLRARPSSVPASARWNASDNEWEDGHKEDGKNVGPFRWWRADGSLLCETTFDETGLLHGTFARYHPNGAPSRIGTFAHGELVGRETFLRNETPSNEHFPVDAKAVVRVIVDHDADEPTMHCFDAKGRETTEFGIPLSKWQNDALFTGVRPERFLADGVESYLRTYHRIPKRLPRVPALDEMEDVWGIAPPGDLARLVRLTSALGERTDGRIFEFLPSFGSPRLPPRGTNLVESLILEEQKSYGALGLVQALAGVVSIGEAQNGDTWHFGLFDHLHSDSRGEGQIYLYNREERTLADPITKDASTFLYLNCVCEARARGVLSSRAFAHAYKRLKKRVASTWHYADLEARAVPDASELFRYKSGAILPRFMFFRGLWIDYLLRNSGTVKVDDVPRVFVESVNEPITEHSWKTWLLRIPSVAPAAMYVLFRCFFFDDEARLAEAVRVADGSPSRLVRDAAKLVTELMDGRKTLGTIRNMKRLKADLLALDLDPNRREQRERERANEPLDGVSRSRARVAARAIDAGVSLEELAWEKIDDASAHDEVLRAMRDRPDMQETLAIVDYIDGDGHAHDNLILEHEREEALLALGEIGSSAIVPILVGRARRGDRKAVEMLAALKDPRAVPHLLGLLDGKADRYHHFDTAVVHALRMHGARSAVPKLLAIVARNPLSDWKTGIERGDLVQEVILALGSLGDRGATPAILKVLAYSNKEYDEVQPLAAGALGALGAREALAPLAQRLDRTRDGAAAEDIWAYGEISAKNPDAHAEARARLSSLSSLDPAADVVRLAALVKLSGASGMMPSPSATDLGAHAVPPVSAVLPVETKDVGPERALYLDAFEAALREPGYRKLDTARQRIWAWRCFGEIGGPSLDAETVRIFTTIDEHGVRSAATKALARRKVVVPEARPYFRFTLDALEQRGGLAALHAAVNDPWGVFRYNVALRLAKIGDLSSVPVLCEALRALYDEVVTATYDYEDPPHHLRWFARALGSFDDPRAHECLMEGLSSKNHHVRQVIASDPPKDERVVPALVRLLDDPRVLLRSRAQHALEQFKRSSAYVRAMEERDHRADA